MTELSEPTAPEALEQRRTAPVELLWDLVFVFAITQVTTLLWRDLTWAGFGRAMLVLALVWWACGGRGRRTCGRPTRSSTTRRPYGRAC